MHFVDVILKNIFRRKLRSSMTALGVAVGIAAVTLLVNFSTSLEESAREVYKNQDVDLIVIRAGVIDRVTSSLTEELRPILARLPGVAQVNGSLTEVTSLGEGSLVGISVHGWRADEFAMQNLDVCEGRRLTAVDRRGVLLGKPLANALTKKVGDSVDIESQPFRVVGLYNGINPMESFRAVVLLDDLQELMDRVGRIGEFQIILDENLPDRRAAADVLQKQIVALQDERGQSLGLSAMPTQQFVDSSVEVRLTHALAWICSGVALLIGGVGMLNTMTMAVLERTQEIGLLRAVGWKQRRVGLLIMCESQLLSVAGAALGLLGGLALTLLLSRVPQVQGLLRADVSAWVLAWAALLAPATGLLGGIYPALHAARLQPIEALRYE